MGYQVIPIAVVTVFWFIVGAVAPWFIPNGPNKGVTINVLILTSICCWLFWLVCYLTQMNPLVGPELKRNTIYMMAKEWGGPLKQG